MTALTERLNTALTGRYEIERELGAGGMATVFLAHDLKHARHVALKVLKPELAAVLGAERFVVEIKTTAALQHPHILPLFDSGTADGFLFYVMPFVEGETLRDKLNRETQLGVDEAVRIAREVLDALQYAHEHGIVHRDVKPENILLHGGHAMVADFGIALAVSAAAGGRMTETGLSLGTPHYMSPEQATAEKEITARSDVYSVGSVLFEMLTGQPPHAGGSAQQIIMKIITTPAELVTVHRKSVQSNVAAAVAKSLEKLPADRFESAKAFSEALGNPTFTNASTVGATGYTVAGRRAVSLRLFVMTTSALAALLLVVTVRGWRRPDPRPEPARFVVTFSDSTQIAGSSVPCHTIALSPDGSKLAFVGRARGATRTTVFLRQIGDMETRAVHGTDDGICPSFSPDGTWLLLFVSQKLVKVPVGGGAPITVAEFVDVRSSGVSVAPSWGDRGDIVFGHRGGIWRVGADGGPVTQLATRDSAGQRSYASPNVLPGGRDALIEIRRPSQRDGLGVVSLSSGKVTDLGIAGENPRYVSSGYVTFGRIDGTVMVAPFSLRTLRLTGAAVPMIEGVVVHGGSGATEIAVSRNGTLAYIAGQLSPRHLVAVDRKGVPRVLQGEPQYFQNARVSPDGRRIAVQIGGSAGGNTTSYDVWVYDVASHGLSRLTTDGHSHRPVWTADGRRLAYIATDSGRTGTAIKWQPWDGSGRGEILLPLPPDGSGAVSFALGPAHGYLALQRRGGGTRQIWIAPLDSVRALRPFVASSTDVYSPAISPDGKLLAYVSEETERAEVYVRPLPGPGARVQVSTEGGVDPAWSSSGHDLFFRGGSRVFAATVEARPEIVVGAKVPLFDDPYQREGANTNYGVFPEGRELLMIAASATGGEKLYVVVNWTEELRRRTAAGAP